MIHSNKKISSWIFRLSTMVVLFIVLFIALSISFAHNQGKGISTGNHYLSNYHSIISVGGGANKNQAITVVCNIYGGCA